MNQKEKLTEATMLRLQRNLHEDINDQNDLSNYTFDQIDNLKDKLLIQKKSIGTSRFHVYQLEGKFIGYDGTEYVALKKVRWGDKTYMTFKNFINQYIEYGGE